MTAKNKALRHCMNTVMLLCWCNNDTRLLMKHINCTPIYSSSIYKCVTIYRLKQNADMTPLLPLVTRPQLVKLTVTQLRLTSSVGEFNSTAIDLGIVLDNHLSMIHTWQAVSQSCFYQLHQLCIVHQRIATRSICALQSLCREHPSFSHWPPAAATDCSSWCCS